MKRKPRLRRRGDRATWLRGAVEIAASIGVDRNQLPELVDKHQLPAFKYLGRWTLLVEDLPKWMQYIKRRYYRGPKSRYLEGHSPSTHGRTTTAQGVPKTGACKRSEHGPCSFGG